ELLRNPSRARRGLLPHRPGQEGLEARGVVLLQLGPGLPELRVDPRAARFRALGLELQLDRQVGEAPQVRRRRFRLELLALLPELVAPEFQVVVVRLGSPLPLLAPGGRLRVALGMVLEVELLDEALVLLPGLGVRDVACLKRDQQDADENSHAFLHPGGPRPLQSYRPRAAGVHGMLNAGPGPEARFMKILQSAPGSASRMRTVRR